MADKTGIAWTNKTASPWHGCAHATYTDSDGNEHAHQGCLNCYAEKMSPRNPGVLGVWGKNGTRVMSDSFHANCRRWNKAAEKSGVQASVFPSICDPFEDWSGKIHSSKIGRCGPMEWWRFGGGYNEEMEAGQRLNEDWRPLTMADLRRDLFATIDACPWLDFLLLTKRPQNVLGMWQPLSNADLTRPLRQIMRRNNVHLLTSISTQADADALIPHLLACRDLVPVLGVSAEPLLSEISIHGWLTDGGCSGPGQSWQEFHGKRRLDWVIIGNESKGKGVGRLPGGTEEGYWRAAKGLIEQCRAAGVAVFHKQGPVDGTTSHDPAEWPEWARVQEFPKR